MKNMRFNSYPRKRSNNRSHGRVVTKIPAPIPPPTAELVAHDEDLTSRDSISSHASSYSPSALLQACRGYFGAYREEHSWDESSFFREPHSRDTSPCPSRSDNSSRHSSPGPYPPPNDTEDKSKLSCYMMYVAILVCVVAMSCFYFMRIPLESQSESCKICDDEMSQPQLVRKGNGINYASESNGAHVALHDTVHYMHRDFSFGDLLHLPRVDIASPDTMLQDNKECYMLQGHVGTFIIHLSRPIIIDDVILQHNKPECDAAPKEFIIYALKNIQDKVQTSLGRFKYDNRGSLAQKFILPRYNEVGYVGIKIMSNWGNKDHTSICKVQVHGKPKF